MGVLQLSFRYLRTRRIALVAVFSIAVGVLAMIVVVSLMDGVQRFLRDHFKGTKADVVIRHPLAGSTIRNHFAVVRRELESEMAEAGGPLLALAPRAEIQALIVPGDRPGPEQEERITGLRILGVDWAFERQVTPLDAMLAAVTREDLRVPADRREDPLRDADPPPILLGDSLAGALHVSRAGGPGGAALVTVIAGRPRTGENGEPTFDAARCRVYQVVGCFSTGREDYDAGFACLDRRELLRLRSDQPDLDLDCATVHARVVEPGRLGEVLDGLKLRHPDLDFQSWEMASRGELMALDDQKRIMVVILSFIIGVAAVAILGIVYLMVVEKTRDIGILRSMGLGRARIVLVFTVYGLVLGIAGCAIGVLVGLQAATHLDRIVAWLSNLLGVQLLDARIYKFKTVPTYVDAASVALITVTAVGMSLLASLLPSLRAAFLTPVRCLRSE